jgi:hypothetical protein
MSRLITKVALTVSTCLLAGTVLADGANEWKKSASVYLWLPSIDGELKFGPVESGGTVDAGKILDSLEMAFMGAFEMSRGDVSFVTDVIYLDLAADKTGDFVTLPGGADTSTKADLGITGWQLGFYGAHKIKATERLQLSGVMGLRYLELDVETQVDITGIQGDRSRKFERSTDVWDAVVGLRGQYSLNDKWFIPFHADAGTGESELTWQFLAGLGYHFENLDTQLIYRHLEWDQGSTGLMQNLSFSGPGIAVRWRF